MGLRMNIHTVQYCTIGLRSFSSTNKTSHVYEVLFCIFRLENVIYTVNGAVHIVDNEIYGK